MSKTNYIRQLLQKRKTGIHCGIPSFCCANKIVIEAILDQAKRFDDYVVIEATSNQVNQYGGYTKMQPKDFADFVFNIAEKIDYEKEKIILGGDHLGPLPWADQSEEIAMAEAEKLVRLCVKAGYTKIHLDTSMRLGSDDPEKPLEDSTIAKRGVRLYKAAEKAYLEFSKSNPEAPHPVYVIGSEVPVPGGKTESEGVKITEPEDFENTIIAYRKAFLDEKIYDAWDNIVAIVVQPGVEFANNDIHHYNRLDSRKLCNALRKYPDIVFEGHSTDYQSPLRLREMVEDGIAILKVGPALTFALREALFRLAMIENELIPEGRRSNFIEVLEQEMLKNPKYWAKYYAGTEQEKHIQRKYGLSDRSRYYMALPSVENSIGKLFDNLSDIEIPMGMLKQYLPQAYARVRDGKLEMKPKELVKNNIVIIVEDYNYAIKCNYIINGVL